MRTPTIAGQYRLVRHTEDGCAIHQCLWCLKKFETRDNPAYGWNFCPACGKSWFTRLMCRPQTIPRWQWDLYGDEDVDTQMPVKQHTKYWHIECRIFDHYRNKWGEWFIDCTIPKRPFKSDYHSVHYTVRKLRAMAGADTEYRVVLKPRQ